MASSSPTANPPQPANNDNATANAAATMADTGFSDESLDRDWKPNGRRPQSYVPLLLCHPAAIPQPLRTDSPSHSLRPDN